MFTPEQSRDLALRLAQIEKGQAEARMAVGFEDLQPESSVENLPEWVQEALKSASAEDETADGDGDEDFSMSLAIVLLPATEIPHADGQEPHLTLLWLGENAGELTLEGNPLQRLSELLPGTITLKTEGLDVFGDKTVLLTDASEELLSLRDRLLELEPVRELHEETEQFPEYRPHVTLGPEDFEPGSVPEEIVFDTLALWDGNDHSQMWTLAAAKEEIVAALTPARYPESQNLSKESTVEKLRWAGVIGMEGVKTGDGRIIAVGGLRWSATPERPLPLRNVVEDVGAHDGARVVGAIESIQRLEPGHETLQAHGIEIPEGSVAIWGEGFLDADDEAAVVAFRKLENKTANGVSMDLDDVVFEVDEVISVSEEGEPVELEAVEGMDGGVMAVQEARVRASTIVAIPAFAEAYIFALGALNPTGPDDTADENENEVLGYDAVKLSADAPSEALPAGGEIPLQTPKGLSELESTIDAPADEKMLQALNILKTTEGLEFLSEEYMEASRSAYELFREVAEEHPEDAEGNRAADVAAKLLRFLEQDWSNVQKSDIEAEEIELDDDDDDFRSMPADALVAAAAPLHPPKAWFSDPKLTAPTPLTITDDGQIYGHLASWGVCHIASPNGAGVCVQAPQSRRQYADFHRGATKTAEGEVLATGLITMNTSHAGPTASRLKTLAHYDHTGTQVADIRVGEDAHGIWVAGALRPDVTEKQIRTLRASPLSGDWRTVGGGLELHAALAVNVPGFPIPRPAGLVASGASHEMPEDGELRSLVAAGMLAPKKVLRKNVDARGVEQQLSESDLKYLKALANRERSAQAAELKGRAQKAAAALRARQNRGAVEAFASKIKGGI